MISRKSRKAETGAPEFPISVRQGSAEVKIYSTPFTKKGEEYPQFTVSYYLGSKRIRDRFSDLGKAKAEAQAAAIKLSNAEHEALKLTAGDRAAYVESLDLLRPLGIPLNRAVSDYVAAVAKLPTGVCLAEAMAEYARRHPSSMPRKRVAEVVAEMIEDAEARKLSPEHLNDMHKRLGRFAAHFDCSIGEVTPAMFRDWIRGLRREDGKPMSNRTKFNFQRLIVSLFHFARRQRYILRELADELAELEAPKPEPTRTEIFTVDEMNRLLASAPEDILPALAIAAFSGLRTAELSRMTWDAVKLSERVIVVGADRAKTASRRIVPMPDNLVEWLTPHVRSEGPVSPSPNDRAMNHRFIRAASRVGVKWRHNGLRHSFISYRLALCADAARVATEAGNSPNMVHRHYKALVSEAAGRAWFDLRPQKASNILAMPEARVPAAATAG
ncbi:MAG: tyrosine-type recombinase/integrase [Verrucomicrobiales bacterium]|nr:tyrosine-type recombinase/integrase [Verrucomicrobiales bacterium]